MKPYVVCHMVASVDGRILHSRWRPQTREGGDLFERLHVKLVGDAWLVGRVTGQEFAHAKSYGAHADRACSREPCEVLEGGAVWLRYRIRNEAAPAVGGAS